MSSEPPPGSGEQPPEDDPFRKRPPSDQGSGSPYDTPSAAQQPPPPGGEQPPPWGGQQPPPYGGGRQPPPYGGGPYGGGPYGGPGGPGGPGYPPDPLAGMPPLADSGKRTLARFVDIVLVTVVAILISLPFGFMPNSQAIATGTLIAEAVIGIVLYVGYDTFTTAKWGQTLGKKWLGMRVANLSDGSTPDTQTALIRALVLWLPALFCCSCFWLVITGGWSFFDKPYKQGLHDKAAKTVVVEVG
ncbi:RDD family protein [Streptomyces diastatochromogenes]|uniref:RDD family protein n=1 Tax=Streptomyces diastatochromogenes TaxID=42236 RepID=UPI00365D0BCA